MSADGTFTISRAALWDAWRRGRLTWDTEVMAPIATDPDAFTPHGGEHAFDRWADDGASTLLIERAAEQHAYEERIRALLQGDRDRHDAYVAQLDGGRV